MLRHKLLLGATPCGANGAGSSRGLWPRTSSPRPGLGAYIRNINESTKKKRNLTSFGQNQGLAWSSDSSLWGNQVHKNSYKFWTEPRPCMVLRLKPMGKPNTMAYKPQDPSEGNSLLTSRVNPLIAWVPWSTLGSPCAKGNGAIRSWSSVHRTSLNSYPG